MKYSDPMKTRQFVHDRVEFIAKCINTMKGAKFVNVATPSNTEFGLHGVNNPYWNCFIRFKCPAVTPAAGEPVVWSNYEYRNVSISMGSVSDNGILKIQHLDGSPSCGNVYVWYAPRTGQYSSLLDSTEFFTKEAISAVKGILGVRKWVPPKIKILGTY